MKKQSQQWEESGDELNDATFGEAALLGIDEEFRFSHRDQLHPRAPPKSPLHLLDPAIAMVRSKSSASGVGGSGATGEGGGEEDEDEDEEERPPGMKSPATSGSSHRILTLEQIESQLRKTSFAGNGAGERGWFRVRSSRPAIISFPDPFAAHDPDQAEAGKVRTGAHGDGNGGVMTHYEQEGIARMHLGQLTTDNPEIEDFYYRSFAKRQSAAANASANGNSSHIPLYLPLPAPRKVHRSQASQQSQASAQQSAVAAAAASLAGVLGKKSLSSSRRPRQQLSVPPPASVPSNLLAASANAKNAPYSVVAAVEKMYEAVFAVEDALANDSDTQYDLQLLQERRKAALSIIETELALGKSSDELALQETLLLRFLNLLALSRAKKILGRALRAIDSAQLSERMLTRIVDLFEYLEVCRVEAPETDINLFVNSILASLVPHVARSPAEQVLAKLATLIGKSSLAWIVCNKAGLVLLCILLSRLEILKREGQGRERGGEGGEPAAGDPPSGGHGWEQRWRQMAESLFDQLQDRLAEVFSGLCGVDSEFYGWQFMALLALNVEADRKRAMVLELRERILMVAQSADEKAIANLNIFLNALGLDASQLSTSL